MRELWNMLQAMFTGIGGWFGYFLGGCDGLLYALIAFTVIDYISGVMCGIVDGKLSSSIGFKGICRLCESSYKRHYTNSIFMRTNLKGSQSKTDFLSRKVRIND